MEIVRFTSKFLESNMYVVTEGTHALLIDPCLSGSLPEGVEVDWLLTTHEHYDHISGVNFWKERTGAPFLCSRACSEGCQNSRRNLSRYFKTFCELQTWSENFTAEDVEEYTCAADEVYDGRKWMDWQGHQMELFECPGHSAGGQCFLFDNEVLFSGDSLIKGYPTICNIPGGSRKKWVETSWPHLKSLDGAIRVYPGHFEPFTLAEYIDEKGADGA